MLERKDVNPTSAVWTAGNHFVSENTGSQTNKRSGTNKWSTDPDDLVPELSQLLAPVPEEKLNIRQIGRWDRSETFVKQHTGLKHRNEHKCGPRRDVQVHQSAHDDWCERLSGTMGEAVVVRNGRRSRDGPL